MKNRKMLDIVGLADEKYISEADPSKKRTAQKQKFKWATFLAAAACFLLILNIAITVPIIANMDEPNDPGTSSSSGDITNPSDGGLIHLPTGSSKPSDSQGSDVPPTPSSKDEGTPPSSDVGTGDGSHIQNPDTQKPEEDNPPVVTPEIQFLKNPALIGALDKYFSGGGYGDNELDQLFPEINDALEQDKAEQESKEEMKDLSDKLGESLDKTDINDNQVVGISEGDLAKRSDKYLYYLKDTKLYVYSINKNKSEAECILPLDGYIGQLKELYDSITSEYDKWEEIIDGNNMAYAYGWEMYLSSDYKTLHIIVTADRYVPMTGVFTLDVSASPTVAIKDFKIFSGSYITSRMVDDQLLLFTRYGVRRGYNKELPESYIPFYASKGTNYFTNDIYFPSDIYSSTYVTVSRLDTDGLRVEESVSFLSFSDEIYVSHNNIFLTREIGITATEDLKESIRDIWWWSREPLDTEIVAIGYKSELFEIRETVTIRGYVKDQYSLDEYEGILRVATTSYFADDMSTSTASLYCIDIDTMKIVASVECFAPEGEVVRSVRFDGTKGYICTSYEEVLIDPVFFFDLSDLNNITYTDTGEIDGYSSSLINIGGGYVIGIGYGESESTLKIEVYKQGENSVEIVCFEEFANTDFATDYKAYYIDRERHLIGLAIETYNSTTTAYENRYMLLHFNGNYFDHIIGNKIAFSIVDTVRGFYKDGYYYVVTDKDFYAFDTDNLDTLPFVSADGVRENYEENSLPDRDPNAPAWPPAN